MHTIEVWAWLLTVSILPGYSSIKSVMLLAILDTNRKFQTTDIVIAFALPSGTTMEQPAHIEDKHMAELLVMVLMVDVKVLVFGN
jgi:hypothetical protein